VLILRFQRDRDNYIVVLATTPGPVPGMTTLGDRRQGGDGRRADDTHLHAVRAQYANKSVDGGATANGTPTVSRKQPLPLGTVCSNSL
jgi:hypothetical protein